MKTRTLGSSGLQVSALGLGCMGMSFGYGPPADRHETIACSGPPSTAASRCSTRPKSYGPFTNEDLLGEALGAGARPRRHRDELRVHVPGERRARLDSRPVHIRRSLRPR